MWWKPCKWDHRHSSPGLGFGEAGGVLIDRIAGESLEGSSACLMVMAYTMMRDGADMDILQQLHSTDPGQHLLCHLWSYHHLPTNGVCLYSIHMQICQMEGVLFSLWHSMIITTPGSKTRSWARPKPRTTFTRGCSRLATTYPWNRLLQCQVSLIEWIGSLLSHSLSLTLSMNRGVGPDFKGVSQEPR